MTQTHANSKHSEGLRSFHEGRFAEAVDLLGRALVEQESSELWNDWGTAQFCCEHVEDAEDGFRRALELDEHNAEAAANLVVLLASQERAAEITPYFDAALPALNEAQQQSISVLVKQSQPRPVTTFQELLNALYRLPQIDKRLPLHRRKALARTYFDSSAYVAACLKLLRQLPPTLQASAARQLGELSALNYQFSIVAAIFCIENNNPKDAIPLLHKACDLNPTDVYAEQLLIQCELAQAQANSTQHPTFSGLDKYLERSFCGRPWEHFEVVSDGAVYMCCSGWMPAPIGNLKTGAVEKIWNSQMAQEIRASVLDGSFKFCSKIHCPFIAGRALPAKTAADESPSPRLDTIASGGPTSLVLSHDASCNLACPSCRNDFVMVAKKEQDEIEAMQNKLIEEAFEKARVLFLDGAGEVFYSKPSRSMLKKLSRERYPNLKLDLITNGLLFNRRAYDEFDLSGRVQRIRVSMDAATESTYKIVRRGGDFAKLLENLKFISELKSEGESYTLDFLFVVSAYNFRDMREFVHLGKSFKADRIQFTAIRNLGHLTAEQFAQINIESPSHPNHDELLSILNYPEFDDPAVDLASISHFRRLHKTVGA